MRSPWRNGEPFNFSEQAQRVPRFVLIGLFVLAGLYTLYFARTVLIPVALAVILSWILFPAVPSIGQASYRKYLMSHL